jgi:HEPN domain-containing protein
LKFGMRLDAVYLAGYTVECALKALILAKCPATERSSTYKKISSGPVGHNLEILKLLLKEQGSIMPLETAVALRIVATWSPRYRYEVGDVSHEEAELFLAAAKEIRDWVEENF